MAAEKTMAHTSQSLRRATLFGALALLLAGCPKPPPEGLITDARGALALAADAERCAEAEYRATVLLVDKAQAAYDAKDYKSAEKFADAARVQAEKAREAARQNPACREQEPTLGEGQLGGEHGQEELGEPGPEEPAAPLSGPHVWTTIYFDFDSFEISTASAEILNGHAAWLKLNPTVTLTVAGHCDEAGSTEYNLALGERRARVVVNYLASLGLDRSKLRVVSYGEEALASDNDNLNRRAEFSVKSR